VVPQQAARHGFLRVHPAKLIHAKKKFSLTARLTILNEQADRQMNSFLRFHANGVHNKTHTDKGKIFSKERCMYGLVIRRVLPYVITSLKYL
jgi:hypothetical protein